MLIKKILKARSSALAVVLPLAILTGCSSICVDPDPRVCPPGQANTSLPPRVEERSPNARAVPPERAPEAAPLAPQANPDDTVRTAPIQLYDRDTPASNQRPGAAAEGTPSAATATATGDAGVRIALLLPMNSQSLGGAAESVRAGFMAGFDRDSSGMRVDLVPTGDAPEETLDAYARAAASHDIVVGPLPRPAVTALAGVALARPTIALNHPDQGTALPPGMLVAGLSTEDESSQVADWAAREHPNGRALILTGTSAWSQRAAGAFEARWSELGRTSQRFDVPSADGRVDAAAIDALKTRLGIDPPDVLFAAVDVVELRQVVAQTGGRTCATIACYGGSSVNPGRTPGMGMMELDGLRLVDIPWLVKPDAAQVMVYPRPDDATSPLYMSRLYALGIDAFRVAREVALRPGAPLAIDGVTGRLSTNGNASKLQRQESPAVYRDGDFQAADNGG